MKNSSPGFGEPIGKRPDAAAWGLLLADNQTVRSRVCLAAMSPNTDLIHLLEREKYPTLLEDGVTFQIPPMANAE